MPTIAQCFLCGEQRHPLLEAEVILNQRRANQVYAIIGTSAVGRAAIATIYPNEEVRVTICQGCTSLTGVSVQCLYGSW